MEVERIANIGRDAFWREYVLPAKPVVLTDMMHGAPVAGLRTREATVAKLGRMPIVIRPEYSRSLLATLASGPNTKHQPETVSLRGYFRIADDDPTTTRMCMEEATPTELANIAPVPAICTNHDGGSDGALVSTIFVGNQGNCAPLHYDGDSRHVVLYQVFGLKRMVVLGAQHGAALRPIANFSTLRWATCPEHERHAILRHLGGVETVLRPGEALFMPALSYHAADYLEDGMSVNFRFGRNRYHELFTAHVHLDPHAQRLMAASFTEESVRTRFKDTYRRVADEVVAATPTSWLKHQRMRKLLATLCDGLDDGAATEVQSSAFVDFPAVVREALQRGHVFKDQLYRQRETIRRDMLAVPVP